MSNLERPKMNARVRDYLLSPAMPMDMGEFAGCFEVMRVTFTFRRPRNLEGGFRLVAALRGALGNALSKLSDRPTGEYGSLFEMLFSDAPLLETSQKWAIPKPYSIWVTEENDFIYVDLNLFGIAAHFKNQLVEAMMLVMLPKENGGEGGVTLSRLNRNRVRWDILDIFWRSREGVVLGEGRESFHVDFLTPVVANNSNSYAIDSPVIFVAMAKRIVGIARWQSIDLLSGFSFEKIDRLFANDLFHMFQQREAKIVVSEHQSKSTDRYIRRVFSHKCAYRISCEKDLWPVFNLGTLTHAGFEVSQGYGRYTLSAV